MLHQTDSFSLYLLLWRRRNLASAERVKKTIICSVEAWRFKIRTESNEMNGGTVGLVSPWGRRFKYCILHSNLLLSVLFLLNNLIDLSFIHISAVHSLNLFKRLMHR